MPNQMPHDPSFGDSFVEPNLPAPNAQKRKGESNQADGTKKSRTDNSFGDQSSRDWFGNDGSNSMIGQSSDVNNESSFGVRKLFHAITKQMVGLIFHPFQSLILVWWFRWKHWRN